MGGIGTKPLAQEINVDPNDLQGWTCTPPYSLCAWGCVCSPCLYAGTNHQIMLMNAFLKKHPQPHTWDQGERDEWSRIMPRNYCCTGISTDAVKLTLAENAAWNFSGSQDAATAVQGLAVINQYEQLNKVPVENQGQFHCALWTRACLCGQCLLCTNAYALRQAHARVPTQPVVVKGEPTRVSDSSSGLLPMRM